MDSFRNAAKAFIINNGKLLLLKRRSNDVHKPGAWDIPGGRLELGEDPYEGLRREVREEIALDDIKIEMPLDIHHFFREDGQKITLMVFLCSLGQDKEITLSEEHQEYKWVDPFDAAEVPEWLHNVAKNFGRIKPS